MSWISTVLRDTVHAEWTKLRTLAGTFWLLAGVAVLTAGVSAIAVGVTRCQAGTQCVPDTTKLSLTGVDVGQALVAVLAVLAVSNEYSTGMIRVSLAAMPRRIALLSAKAGLVACLVLAAGALAVAGSLLAGRLMLAGNGFTVARGFLALSLGHGPTLRAAAGSVLYLALIALLSVGVAAIVRDSAMAIGSVLGLLYVFPIIVASLGGEPNWQRRLESITPMNAGLDIQATTGLHGLPLTPWAGLGVLALWALVALAGGGVLLWRRDA
jgi:ABC-2 type transport system permease protein